LRRGLFGLVWELWEFGNAANSKIYSALERAGVVADRGCSNQPNDPRREGGGLFGLTTQLTLDHGADIPVCLP
jgi:hypothetical protein